MLMGHLNQAWFLLGGQNFGAGRPFLLKNDHLVFLARQVDGTPVQNSLTLIQNLELRLVLYLIKPSARRSKISLSKVDFFKILILGDFKYVNGTPEAGLVSFRRPKFWSWKAFFAPKLPFGFFLARQVDSTPVQTIERL
jgi:hypothetical protein